MCEYVWVFVFVCVCVCVCVKTKTASVRGDLLTWGPPKRMNKFVSISKQVEDHIVVCIQARAYTYVCMWVSVDICKNLPVYLQVRGQKGVYRCFRVVRCQRNRHAGYCQCS